MLVAVAVAKGALVHGSLLQPCGQTPPTDVCVQNEERGVFYCIGSTVADMLICRLLLLCSCWAWTTLLTPTATHGCWR